MDRESRPRPGRGALWWGLVLLPLGAAVYAALLSMSGIGRSVSVLGRLEVAVTLLAAGLQVVVVVSLGQAYRASLRAFGNDLPLGRVLNVSMSAFLLTQIIPGGAAVGVVEATRRLIRLGVARAAAAAAVALTGTVLMLTLAVVTAVGLAAGFAVTGGGAGPVLAAVATAAVLAGVVAAVLAVVRRPARVHRILDAAEGLTKRLGLDLAAWRGSVERLTDSPPRAAAVARVAGWAAVKWSADLATLWLLLAALGEPVPAVVLLTAFGVEHLAVALPLSPGGLGLVEAGVSGALIALGVPGSVAVPAVLGYRLVSYWLPVAAGAVQFLRVPPGRPGPPVPGGDGGRGPDGGGPAPG